MKFTVTRPTEVDIKYVVIDVPVKYDDEDMPNDFPFRAGDQWRVAVEIETGRIIDWPHGVSHDLYMKVTDGGSYILLDEQQNEVACIVEDYVPHGVVPGEYGDYIEMDIDENGIIKNWPDKDEITLSDFFPEDN
jgi:hypothetical protein